MSQNKRVMNLFGFLMELLDEQNTTQETNKTSDVKSEEVVDELNSFIYKLRDPILPPHPELNPIIKVKNKLTNLAPHAVSLMNKMREIDKENSAELMKVRVADKATKPLIAEIEKLKSEASDGALEDKTKEEHEYLDGNIETFIPNVKNGVFEKEGERLGVMVQDGVITPVSIPTELRNNIPINDDDDTPMISKEMQDYLEQLSNTLPKPMKRAMMGAPTYDEPIETAPSEVVIKKTKKTKKPVAKKSVDKK